MNRQSHIPEHLQELANPAYRRLWEEARKKYRQAGGVGQQINVRLAKLEQEECERLPVLLWTLTGRLKPGGLLEVTLAELEEELAKHPYYVSNLKEWFTILYNQELLTNKEQARRADQIWQGLFSFALEEPLQSPYPPAVVDWLSRLRDGQAEGYRTLKDILRTQSSDSARAMLQECTDALAALYTMQSAYRGVRLPVLANRFTGDPHGLDWSEKRGRLFYFGIVEIWVGRNDRRPETMEQLVDEQATEVQTDGGAADGVPSKLQERLNRQSLEMRAVYRMAGVRDDDVSSQVLVWGEPFSGHQAAALTLQQVEGWADWPSRAAVYIVENPAVFSSLLDAESELSKVRHASGKEAKLLVCWSGQPSAAATLLLDNLNHHLAVGCPFFYSGDFDVNGLAIANSAATRYRTRFRAWRMDFQVYEQHVRDRAAFTEQEKSRLKKCETVWDGSLGQRMADYGYKCYQESVLPLLIRDWIGEEELL